MIVTGAKAGIVFKTALALFEAGAHVVLACRNLKNAENLLFKLHEVNEKGPPETGVLDLSDPVKRFILKN